MFRAIGRSGGDALRRALASTPTAASASDGALEKKLEATEKKLGATEKKLAALEASYTKELAALKAAVAALTRNP